MSDTFKDLQTNLISSYRKGDIMNEQITTQMAELADKPTLPQDQLAKTGQPKVVFQTEAEVGAETPETKVQ